MARKSIEQIRAELDELNARMEKKKNVSDIQLIANTKTNKQKASNDLFRHKMSLVKTGKSRPDMFGDKNPKRSEENRKKQSDLMKGVSKTKEQIENFKKSYQALPMIVCPHCKMEGKNQGNMNRYHFDNCKHKV